MSLSALRAEAEELNREGHQLASEIDGSMPLAVVLLRAHRFYVKRRAWFEWAEGELAPNPGDSWPGLAEEREALEDGRLRLLEDLGKAARAGALSSAEIRSVVAADDRLYRQLLARSGSSSAPQASAFDRARTVTGTKVVRSKRFETRRDPDGRIVLVGVEEIERTIADSQNGS